MRPIVTRADLYGPSAGVSYSGVQKSPGATESAQGSVPVVELFGKMKTSVMANPIMWLAGVILALVAWKLIEEYRGGEEEYHEVKIGVSNWAKIGFMVLVFFATAKFLATKYDVPGASKFVLYATS